MALFVVFKLLGSNLRFAVHLKRFAFFVAIDRHMRNLREAVVVLSSWLYLD